VSIKLFLPPSGNISVNHQILRHKLMRMWV